MFSKKSYTGFTIVELLIVIVVIGILAAITIVSYNGIQKRAQDSTAKSDLRTNSTKLLSYATTSGNAPTTSEINTVDGARIKLSGGGMYSLVGYCSAGQDFVIAAQTAVGSKFYIRNGQAVVADNSIDVLAICNVLNIRKADGSVADATYVGVSTAPCANEGGICSFSGVKTVIYGANGRFAVKTNISSSINCTNAVFGDPIGGVVKQCFTTTY